MGEGKQLFSQPFCQGLAGLRNSSLRYGSRESNPMHGSCIVVSV